MGHRVLVTGGAGYIGSVVVEQLLARGHVPIALDDLSTGHRAAMAPGVEFVQGNVGDRHVLEDVFQRHRVDGLMHFAAFALVAESVANPAKYHANNVVAGRVLLDATVAARVRRVIFSSSCTIYGHRGAEPIGEDTPAAPVNPYGETKVEFERMLGTVARSHGVASVSLRYFNAAGASGRYGEDHEPETHLIPNVLRVAQGRAPRDRPPRRDARPAAPAGRSALPGGRARPCRAPAGVAAAALESGRDHRERVGVAPCAPARVRELRRVDRVLLLQVGRAVPTTPWELEIGRASCRERV